MVVTNGPERLNEDSVSFSSQEVIGYCHFHKISPPHHLWTFIIIIIIIIVINYIYMLPTILHINLQYFLFYL